MQELFHFICQKKSFYVNYRISEKIKKHNKGLMIFQLCIGVFLIVLGSFLISEDILLKTVSKKVQQVSNALIKNDLNLNTINRIITKVADLNKIIIYRGCHLSKVQKCMKYGPRLCSYLSPVIYLTLLTLTK